LLNNLEIKKCLYIILGILFAMVGMVGLSALGFNIPVFRQLFGFMLLTIIPGALILRLLKIQNISTAESLAYSVGLSIAFDMSLGFLMNVFYPFIGIAKPISLYPVTITFAVAILVLCVLAYLMRDKNFVPPSLPNFLLLISPPYLFLMLLPLLAILGALLVNYYQNNLLLLVFLAAVAATFALGAFNKFIPEIVYPLAITLIAIGLVYHTSATLASPFITGYDIQAERLLERSIATNGYWSATGGGNLNTALSIVVLWPAYSLVLNLDAAWVIKLVYPLIFSLVPLILFLVYREQVGSRRAFLSAFLFMSVLYFLVPGMGTRMVIGELFLVLLLLMAVEQRLASLPKTVLTLVFINALPVSYYSLTYISLFLFLTSWLALILIKNKFIAHWLLWVRAKITGNANHDIVKVNKPKTTAIITGSLIGLFIVFSLSWYMYTASGSMFHSIVNIPRHALLSLNEFFNPLSKETLVGTATGVDFVRVSMLGRGFRIFQYAAQIFIIIGFIAVLLKPRSLRFRAEYLALSGSSALVLFLALVLPRFSGNLELERFYHFALLFLSPFCIIGGEVVWRSLSRWFRIIFKRMQFQAQQARAHFNRSGLVYANALTMAVLIPYFLYNTGFIFEVAKSDKYDVVDTPSAEALSSYRIDTKGTNRREYHAIEWLGSAADSVTPIYADIYGVLKMSGIFGDRANSFPLDGKKMPEKTYIYLKTWNLEKNEAVFMIRNEEQIYFEHVSFDALPELSSRINNENLVYDNGGAQIFAP